MSSSTCEDSALDGGPWDGTDVKSATKSAIPLAMVALATVVPSGLSIQLRIIINSGLFRHVFHDIEVVHHSV
jgi:hypothetical protein